MEAEVKDTAVNPPDPPIITPSSRRPTEIVDHTLQQALEGENVDKLLKTLSGKELELFQQLLGKIHNGEITTSMIDELWRVDYIRKPPTMREFLADSYWLGDTQGVTDESPGLFPGWVEVLESDFDLDSRVHNAVLTGSLGTGKTHVMAVIFLFRIALARMLRNPQYFFGLLKGSPIVFNVMSLTKGTVRETIWEYLSNFMSHSAFFMEECHYNPDAKYSSDTIPMGNRIIVTLGSKGWHLIGRNVMGCCMDEGNFRIEANPDEAAYRLFNEVRIRIVNRFQKREGFLPAISLLASSARDESSFTEQVIEDIEKANDPKTQNVYRFSVYKIKRHLLNLENDRWFRVSYGLKNQDPIVLSGWYDAIGNEIKDASVPHEKPFPGAKTELVPERYRDTFVRNTRTSLQSICGISTGGSHRLFSSVVNIERCIEITSKTGLTNPSLLDHIPISHEDSKEVWDYLDHRKFLTKRHSQVVPIRHPDALRFAHVDLATRTMAGLSVCHLVGSQLVDDVKDGEPMQEYRLIVEFDFILTIVSGQNKPISLEKIQKFIIWLKKFCGFNFGLITADQFQSAQALQMLEARGFPTNLLSVDRSKAPYYQLRQAFDELRVRIFRQDQLMRELENLVDGDKIDHPSTGSKDTADSVAGAFFNAYNFEEKSSATGTSVSPALYNDSAGGFHGDSPITIDTKQALKVDHQVFYV